MIWSVHKYDKRLDCTGKAIAQNFNILSHTKLADLITFCLQDDSFCQSAGTCGPEPLHCLWVGPPAPKQPTSIACGASTCTNSFMP